MQLSQKQEIQELIREAALAQGFEDVAFVAAEPLLEDELKFLDWREKGYAGSMSYLTRENPINARPQNLLKGAQTLISMTVSYFTFCPPRPSLDYGRVASYAVGLDYHKVLKKKAVAILQSSVKLQQALSSARFFTDAVPLLEKSFAREAGLGFQGNNTLLISRETGSYKFILEFVTDLDLVYGGEGSAGYARSRPALDTAVSSLNPHLGTCGGCRRCLDICPTQALVSKNQLDSRLCISYLTIENRAPIQEKLRKPIGEWVFGCDICQEVCPYNLKQVRKLQEGLPKEDLETKIQEFHPDKGSGHWLYLPEILTLDKVNNSKDDEANDKIFHERFCRTPLSRPKRKGLIRNAIIAASNLKSPESYPLVEKFAKHSDFGELASWALFNY